MRNLCKHFTQKRSVPININVPAILSGFGQRSFSVSGPDAWNSLPRQLRGIAVASTFKRHFKV